MCANFDVKIIIFPEIMAVSDHNDKNFLYFVHFWRVISCSYKWLL